MQDWGLEPTVGSNQKRSEILRKGFNWEVKSQTTPEVLPKLLLTNKWA